MRPLHRLRPDVRARHGEELPVELDRVRRPHGDEHVQEVAGAAAVQRADRVRLTQAEGQELPDVVVPVGAVDLVGDDEDRDVPPPQEGGDSLAGDSTFQNASKDAHLGDSTFGFLYLNVPELVELVEGYAGLSGESIPPEVSRNLEPLGAFLVQAGDSLRFEAIDASTFHQLEQRAAGGEIVARKRAA